MKKNFKNLFLFVFLVFFAVTPILSQPKFSLKLVGGVSSMDGGDLNEAIKDYNRLYADYDALGFPASFDLDELRWIPNFKGELIISLSSNFAIGIGTEYLSKTNKGTGQINYSEVTDYPDETYSYEIDNKDDFSVSIKATPILLNFYYFFPTRGKITAFIYAGVAYYFASFEQTDVYDYDYEDAYESPIWNDWIYTYSNSGTWKENAKDDSFGFQGGLGFEFDFTSRIALVAEISGRIANFKNWSGDRSDDWRIEASWWDEIWGTDSYSDSGRDVETGKLWADTFTDYMTDKSYKTIGIDTDGDREAKINLNGFQFRIGIRIKI